MTSNELCRREFLGRTVTFTAAALPFFCAVKSHAGETSPNFVFILSDDQGWTGTSVSMDNTRDNSKSDYYLTPNLERLATGGMRFTQGYAPAPLCCPTRRSIQFGQVPLRQGDARFPANYKPGNKHLTIPRLLKEVDPNYAAAHFGKWDLRCELVPEDLGYDESDGNTGNRNGDIGSDFDKKEKWTEHTETEDPKCIFSLTDRANDFMERQVQAGRPFYLQVSHYAVHVDVQTRPETIKKYGDKTKGKVHNDPAYAGMTEDLDTGVGKLLDKLDALGITDNTYVFYMADNGAVPFVPPDKKKHLADPQSIEDISRNYPLRSGKWTLFEGGIRVPFIIRGPGAKKGALCDVPVVGYDILPTVADFAGFKSPLPADLDGGSLRGLLEGGESVVVKRPFDGLVFDRPVSGYPHAAIRLGDYKLVKFWEPEAMKLFNVRKDIGETNDLAASMPEKAQELHDELMRYLRSMDAEILKPVKGGSSAQEKD